MPGEATSIRMIAAHRRFLEKRGARSHRGGSAFSRSAVVERALEELALYLKWTDPRKTRGFPEAMHAVLVRRLPEPWKRTPHEIETLEGYLRRSPEFFGSHCGRWSRSGSAARPRTHPARTGSSGTGSRSGEAGLGPARTRRVGGQHPAVRPREPAGSTPDREFGRAVDGGTCEARKRNAPGRATPDCQVRPRSGLRQTTTGTPTSLPPTAARSVCPSNGSTAREKTGSAPKHTGVQLWPRDARDRTAPPRSRG